MKVRGLARGAFSICLLQARTTLSETNLQMTVSFLVQHRLRTLPQVRRTARPAQNILHRRRSTLRHRQLILRQLRPDTLLPILRRHQRTTRRRMTKTRSRARARARKSKLRC